MVQEAEESNGMLGNQRNVFLVPHGHTHVRVDGIHRMESDHDRLVMALGPMHVMAPGPMHVPGFLPP